ncbi:MAG TPA: lysophospholipid acyltransferase family protein [Solirubrobacteraceae bacterium]|nr:lysophospholipid acyltransferase family protein [Solirubrobacteraceae bacterium]
MPEALDRLLAAAPGPVEGTLRMAAAAAADVAHAVDVLDTLDRDATPTDPLDARDPEYIRQTLPAMRSLSDVYFRGDVRGLENIPADEPALLVGNHSGGTLIADTLVFGQAFYDHFGPERRFHQLAHDLVLKVPGTRATLSRWGTIPASPENMRRALGLGAALLVYPGGDHETYRPSWQSSDVDFAGRTGFAKLALELGTPIIPVVAIGGQETALFLGRGRRLAKALRLSQLLRLKVLPVQFGPPLGLTVLDLPGRIPLPAKITIRVLPRLHLREQLGDDADVEDAYRLVTGTMQDTLDDLSAERALPVIG